MEEPSATADPLPWIALLAASGAVSLGYEALWIRRLGLVLGGSAVASAVVVGAFMAGLALGAALSGRLPGGSRTYAALEAAAAAWALALPAVLDGCLPAAWALPGGRWWLAVAVLLPPATALGATWPVVARAAGPDLASTLYAANTTGAVVGVLAATFVLMPALGVRGTELCLAAVGFGVAGLAASLRTTPRAACPAPAAAPPAPILAAAAAAGFAALGLEVAWMRLAAVALGATVQTVGWVLATFLATVAAGAWVGRRWPADPWRGLSGALAALAALALLGAMGWGQLPLWVSALYRWAGPRGMLPGSAILAAAMMGGAPVASGVAFACAVRALGPALRDRAGALYAWNTAGGIAGSWIGGLWAIPALELRGAVLLFAGAAAASAVIVGRRPWQVLPAAVLAAALPAWDARLYAVGVYLRISDFADPSPGAVRAFAREGWELLYYDHGPTGAVAVGESTRTGNRWLSINGKVDASTGDDMPTQVWSGVLPVRIAGAEDVLVVGLASGITAGAVLDQPGVRSVTVVELEPAVIRASRFFDRWSGAPLDDPRTTLVVDDARAVLLRPGPRYDAIVSEPSNPWITGVSSLFTLEYWRAGRARLRDGGVFVQWVQLYGMGPDAFRGVVRTFVEVFPDTWLFETIEGSDVLLVGGVRALPSDLGLEPTLDPDGVRRLAGEGWLNTDDHPRVEWEAPRWLHYRTAPDNRALIQAAAATPP